MKRYFYTTQKAIKHRKQLGKIKNQGHGSVHDVDLEKLKASGIETLVFDFDGVLSGHGEPIPHETAKPILQKSCEIFGKGHVFILSNKPTQTRDDYFKQHFPEIEFIIANRKKPYPDGIKTIIEKTGSPANKVALIDDRLLTGALASCITNAVAVYIDKPKINHKHQPISEMLFWVIRKIEKLIF